MEPKPIAWVELMGILMEENKRIAQKYLVDVNDSTLDHHITAFSAADDVARSIHKALDEYRKAHE